MNPRLLPPTARRPAGWCLLALLLAGWAATPLQAAEEQRPLVAQLIWGTNNEKPKDCDFKDVSADVQKTLTGIFKWKNYWEVTRKAFAVEDDKPTRLEMSKDCTIEVRRLKGDKYEIKLFGKGQSVVTHQQKLPPGEKFMFAGDAEKQNAWFVVLAHKAAKP
jgi:hypothetical protein